MNQERIEELAAQWQAICGQFSETDLSYSFEFIQQHVTVLVAEFYRQMMQEQEASYFLSDELVRSRLKMLCSNGCWTVLRFRSSRILKSLSPSS